MKARVHFHKVAQVKTAVLQSYKSRPASGWMALCQQSVETWSNSIGADYHFIDDQLFDYVPDWVKDKTTDQIVIATDLARLRWMQDMLTKGYGRVLWLDIDSLVFAPDVISMPETDFAVGREVWVQKDRTYKKVHNAALMATKGSSSLSFYADAAERMLARAEGVMVPQFIGPKFLTALHNMVQFDVLEWAGMLSPLAMHALLHGGSAFDDTLKRHSTAIGAFNLSSSYCGREADGVCNDAQAYEKAAQALLAHAAS